jgi:hypothetical protein
MLFLMFRGMRVTSGKVTILKDTGNLIGQIPLLLECQSVLTKQLKMGWTRSQRLKSTNERVLPWLVRWAAMSSHGCPSRPSSKYFFPTTHYFNSFVSITQQAWQAVVLGLLSLSMCLWTHRNVFFLKTRTLRQLLEMADWQSSDPYNFPQCQRLWGEFWRLCPLIWESVGSVSFWTSRIRSRLR